jgi:hypothetical protein
MSLARVLAGVRSGRDRVCALGLLLVLVALLPLADASPPDLLWVPGLYDGADFDEVVVAASCDGDSRRHSARAGEASRDHRTNSPAGRRAVRSGRSSLKGLYSRSSRL